MLTRATPEASDDNILAEVQKRMPQPTGDVEVLHVPRVILQPGELGCRADTALRPVDQMRAQH